MKRILYLHAGAEMYGADKVLLELIKGLDRQEFEAHVILPNDGVLVEALRQVGAQVSVLDYPILRRKYFNPKGILEYLKSYRRYSQKIAQYVRGNGIDLVHNNTTAVLEGVYLKRKVKLPLIWHVHEIIVKPKAISDFINFLMGRYADKIVTVSQAVASHVNQSPFIKEDQVQVIYNGVDNAVYHPMQASTVRERFAIPEESLVIGMVGRVNAWKGQGDFLWLMKGQMAYWPLQISLQNCLRLFRNWLTIPRRGSNLVRPLSNAKKNSSPYKVIFEIFRSCIKQIEKISYE